MKLTYYLDESSSKMSKVITYEIQTSLFFNQSNKI